MGSTPAAQDLDAILARYAAARGGLERWRAVRSLAMAGSYTTFSDEKPFTLERRRPNLYRFESDMLGRHHVLGYDGKAAWWIQPLFFSDWAVRTPQPDAGMIAREAEFEPALLGWREKGHRVELLGPGDLDGQRTVDLELTLASGAVETWHLDPATGLEVAVDSTVWDFTQSGDPMPQRAYYSDFRTVDGLVLPFRIEKEFGPRLAVLALASAKVDPELAESRFAMPLPEGMEALRPLAGEWEVKVETRSRAEDPWQAVATTTSAIVPLLEGALLEERFEYPQFGGTLRVVRSFSFDRFAGRYRLAQIDDSTSHLNVFEGRMEAGRATLSNERTGTVWKLGETTFHERLAIHDVGPDGFGIDGDQSTDGGKTWVTTTRYTYTRKSR